MVKQRGSVLIVALVLLLVLTLLGISGIETTMMQERMAGNTQELMSAFQAAEAGLRDGEDDVRANISVSSVFDSSCTNGLCEPAATGYDVWATTVAVYWDDDNAGSDVNTRVYGDNTGVAALQDVSRQPAYIIERLNVVERGGSIVSGFSSQPPSEWYRLTSRGFGRNGQSQATVQAVVRR
jgi:type IV pilus assembly protein PilX